ncbi:J domain-containing protein [Psychroserpens algicola]|uniref:J domain-containing protein n=1 Tax=Psychroserpens algicola TaxID=1719034 RepID=A0ABT0H551_9FLAO|nr:J domain-containing protein [Psychroserpens algicola]MCK8479519.1 J domain-containing protein [Psychroserpens algicola]
MELPNYYRLLNIDNTADVNDIKKAFRTEIALYHPDNNSSEDAKVRFNQLVEAFDILSNPKKRHIYDDMLLKSKNSTLVVVEPQAETQYKEWKEESKKNSEHYWSSSLTELLALDLFLDAGLSTLFSGDLIDGIEDAFGDIGDLFDIF